MAQKKYASLESLQTFKDNLDGLYATQETVDGLSADIAKKLDINAYVIDEALSPESSNPVQNKVIDAEFEAVSQAMNALEQSIDGKSDSSHIHSIDDVSDLQSNLDTINDTLSQKSQVQMITSDVSEVLSTLKIHKISQEQYDQELANGTLDDNAIYLTPDEEVDLSGYATIEQLNGKADIGHSHDDLYYTEAEIDALLLGKSGISHNHDDKYDTKGSADGALASAKSYADDAANAVKNDLLNGAGEAYDTLKELGDLINENVNAIEALETIASGKADIDHTHNDIYYQKNEINTMLSGKSDASHTHSDYVQTSRTVNGKALTSNITLSASDVGALPDTTIIPSIDGLATETYVNNVASNKVDKVGGKGLSTNDYTTDEKNKLASIASGAQVNVQPDWNQTTTTADDYIKNKPTSMTPTAHKHTKDEITDFPILGSAAYTDSTAYDASGSADVALTSAKTYTDNAVAQKSLIQIITWEDDD